MGRVGSWSQADATRPRQLASALAFGAALGLARLADGTRPIHLVAWVIVGDLIGAALLAPLAVGELELIHAPTVFAAITALGLQPLAAAAGAWAAGRAYDLGHE